MELIRWSEVPVEEMSPTVRRQVVWGDKGTLVRFSFDKGAHVAAHSHDAEQHTCVIAGAIKIKLAGVEKAVIVGSGEVLVIPGNVEHEVWVLEDAVLLDFFSPPRHDWSEGKHHYLAADKK